jgi:adenine-specific DNA-methyltransferase
VPDGLVAVWPIRTNGSEGRWTLGAEKLRDYAKKGMAKVGAYNKKRGTWSISYLISKDIKRIEDGEISVVGRDDSGVLLLELAEETERKKLPRTVWYRDAHNAGTYGSALLGQFIPGRKFPFPKSLYLLEDMLSVFVSNNKSAIVLDFFSGSGTTAHALMRLNKQDGGRRQCISVTNNEVGADEQKTLREQGLRPGDAEWEKLGICDYITKPRVHAAITGQTPDGEPIEGEYLFGKIVEQEKPRSFLQIGFTESNMIDSVTKKKQLVALVKGLPQTLVKEPCPFIVSEEHTSSILFDTQHAEDWLEALEGQTHITDFYIVTAVKRTFDRLKQEVAELLGPFIVNEVEKVPMSEGFEENAEFFTLDLRNADFRQLSDRLCSHRAVTVAACGQRRPPHRKTARCGLGCGGCLWPAGGFGQGHRFPQSRCARRRLLRIAYIVTDDERRFQTLARRLPEGVEAIRLYESYLTNFAFANGDDA